MSVTAGQIGVLLIDDDNFAGKGLRAVIERRVAWEHAPQATLTKIFHCGD